MILRVLFKFAYIKYTECKLVTVHIFDHFIGLRVLFLEQKQKLLYGW